MSKDTAIQIIEIISEKLGIVVDYTTENVIPYVVDLMHRYIIYINVSNFISLFIDIIILSIFIIITRKSIKKIKIEYNNKEKSDCNSAVAYATPALIVVVGIIFGVASVTFGVMVVVPETIEFIQILLKSIITPELFMIEQLRTL